MSEPSLVPELLITDIESSINFWCTLCDFSIQYERREEGFAYLVSGNTHIMLEQRGFSRNWITGDLDVPYGRGINFQISIESVDLIVNRLQQQKWPLYMDPEEKWYQKGDREVGVRQFLVQDPDGYLLRIIAVIGDRAIS